jgi:hypothetical protein
MEKYKNTSFESSTTEKKIYPKIIIWEIQKKYKLKSAGSTTLH